MTQARMAEMSRELRFTAREEIMDAVDAYSTASVAYGRAIFGEAPFVDSILDAGARKDAAYGVLLKLVGRLLS